MNCKKILSSLFSLILCCSPLFGEELGVTISSEAADCKDRILNLTGNVTVEHPLGKMCAEHISIASEKNDRNNEFSEIAMEANVSFSLTNGGVLSCHRAILKLNELEATFFRKEENDSVQYTEKFSQKDSGQASFTMQSPEMCMQLGREQAHYYVNTIHSGKGVTLNYNDTLTVLADYADYQRVLASAVTEKKDEKTLLNKQQLAGLVHLSTENGHCTIKSKWGDLIHAHDIAIDTQKRTILCSKPTGTVFPNREAIEVNKGIQFSSQTLSWDDLSNTLCLRNDITLKHPELGTLAAEKELRFLHHNVDGEKQLRAIEVIGKTILEHVQEEKELSHQLICHGESLIDQEQHVVIMKSPLNEVGEVLENQQVTFLDSLGEIYADKLIISYAVLNGKPKPSKLVLEGHVKLLNRGAIDYEKTKAYFEYALADSLEYTPDTKEVLLKAKENNRVLFYDRINHLEISAPALRIKRDETTKKESIQGIGDVRFNFVEKELEKIKEHFQSEK